MFSFFDTAESQGNSGNSDFDAIIGNSFSSSSTSSLGISPYDSSKDDDDACFEEVQQGFLRREPHYNDTNNQMKATPKTLFSGTGNANNDDHYHHDRNNSDSNSSTEELRSRRAMIMESTALPPRNNASREKYRRRTRSSSRRSSSSNINNMSPQSLPSEDYEGGGENKNIQRPFSMRRRSSQQPSRSISSSYNRQYSPQGTKQPSAESFEGYSIENRGNPHHCNNVLDYSSPELSSESSPDSSPSRLVTDMYKLQQNDNSSSQEQRFSSPRSSLPSKSRNGVESPTSFNSPYSPSLNVTKSPLNRSPSSSKLSISKAKLLKTSMSWCLLGSLIGMAMISISGMVLLTNRAVPMLDSQEVFVPTLPDRFDDSGLRGKKVLGRMWDISTTNIEDTISSMTDLGTMISNEKKQRIGNHAGVPARDGVARDKQSKKRDKFKRGTTVLPQRLQLRTPPSISIHQEPKFDLVDPNLYVTSSSFNKDAKFDSVPRIVVLDPSVTRVARKIETYPADFSDNTQLYGILPSDDERLDKMEMRDPYSKNECVPMQEWQTTYQPSCNGMHELALQTLGASTGQKGNEFKPKRGELEGLDASLFGTKGFWRYAWKLVIGHYDNRKGEEDTIVFKNLKYEHNFEDAHFEHDRIDAIAMERLTSSPHVINIFGFCGHSVLTEYAGGKRLGQLADKSKKTPLKRLEIARDIANGLADVHGIDGDGNTTFVHLDINPANVVSVNNTLKLNDFNIGIIRQWNTTSNEACGFPTQYPNPQWRSPEEARSEQHLTEKVDIFSLGHIFFRLICGHEPWNKLEPGGRPTKEEVNEKVQRGDLPFIPDHITNSDDPEIIAVRNVMLKCYSFDPTQRPSARNIANALDRALKDLQRKHLNRASDSKNKSESKKKRV